MRKFFIAAGHGGKDPGACAQETTEREENIRVVDAAVAFAKPYIPEDTELVVVPHEFAVIETVRWINYNITDKFHDLCLEVHHNSNLGSPGTGTEVWFGNYQLAKEVKDAVVGFMKLADRGVKSSVWHYFNKATECASAILEVGFINNPIDLEASRKYGGEALGRAIVVAAGGEVVGAGPPEPPAAPPLDDVAIINVDEIIRQIKDLLEDLRVFFSPSIPTVTAV